jgi:hypothetical protein
MLGMEQSFILNSQNSTVTIYCTVEETVTAFAMGKLH